MFAWLMRLLRWLLLLFRRRKPTAAPGFASGGGYPRRDPRPMDPLSGVRQPLARRPGGNTAAVAVEEPEDEESLTLVGASR